MFSIQNGLVYTREQHFEPLSIQFEQDLITSLRSPEECLQLSEYTVIDAAGCYVIPGLTDIHFHGCDGYDFCDATQQAYEGIASFMLHHGVTSICPATMTVPLSQLDEICHTAAKFQTLQKQHRLSNSFSELVGIHMEGPFISKEKKGAQNDTDIQLPDSSLIEHWIASSQGLVRLISLAPELPNALQVIQDSQGKILFSIAHTMADYATAAAAMNAGVRHVTHLYNAMPPFHHRDSGVIGAAFDTPDCYVELICDGIHISAPVVRATFQLFSGRVVLISDSMRAAGKPDGCYTLGGQDVNVSGAHATLADGTLAGSVTPLYSCMRNVISMGIPLEEAIAAATINPCRSIGIDDRYGSIFPGKKAHFLLIDQKTLEIKKIIKE